MPQTVVALLVVAVVVAHKMTPPDNPNKIANSNLIIFNCENRFSFNVRCHLKSFTEVARLEWEITEGSLLEMLANSWQNILCVVFCYVCQCATVMLPLFEDFLLCLQILTILCYFTIFSALRQVEQRKANIFDGI